MEAQAKYEVATQEGQGHLGLMQEGVSLFLDIQRFEFAQRVANMLSKSTMLPEQFRGNLGNCMIALDLANRMRVNPFMLMQTMYIVHNKPGIEAKLAIALFNDGTRRLESPLKYEKEGKEYPKSLDSRCRAYAKDIKSGENLYGEWIDWDMVKGEGWLDKSGSKWKTMPGQMFVYRAAMFFIREYEPGVLLGLRTKDELDDIIIDVTPLPSLKIEGTKEPEPGKDPYEVKAVQKEKPPTNGGGEGFPPPPDDPPPLSSTQKMGPETMDEKALYREEWVNLRSAGYATFIHKNFKRIEENGKRWPDLYQEMKEKWGKLYKEPWPLVEKVQGNLAPVDQGEKVETDTLSDADNAFIVEVEEYKDALDEKDFSTILTFYGVAKKPVTELEGEGRERFLSQLKKALDKQNAV